MKRAAIPILLVCTILLAVNSSLVFAQPQATSGAGLSDEATSGADVAEATDSAEASGAAQIVRRITEKSSDLTEPQGVARGKLEQYVLE